MLKQTKVTLSLALLLVAGLSCDRLVAPATTGTINLVLLSASGTPVSITARNTSESVVNLSGLGSPVNIQLDGVRVTVTGPMTRTLDITTSSGGFFRGTVDQLVPGSYTVVVEGLVGGLVGHYGEQSNVSVTAGATTTAQVAFPVFQPEVPSPTIVDTVD